MSNNVLKDTLSNGLRVVIVKNPLAPVVTTEINYLVGSNEAPEGFPGTAHALEHMMFRGSKGLSADQLADITASMGGDFNADTRQNVTQYFFTVPSEDLDLALHIESIRMKGILATDSLWENERGAIEQEVAQDNSNPQYIIYTKLLKAMFKGTPYEHDALGTKASFDKTTGAMLQQFHNTWYAPNNAVLVIAGDVNLQNTLSKVKKYFGDIPRKKLPVKPAITLQNVETDTLKSPTDLPYGLVFETFRMPGTESPDYYSAQILSDVLSSQRGELYSLLVPTGKALYAGFQYSALPKSGLGFAFAVYPKGSDAKTLIKEMNKIISNQVKKGFSQDLVEAEKRQELTSAEFQKNSISGLADDWSEAVAVDGKESPDNELNALEKVTLKDVNNAALKYLNNNHVIYAILNPESSGKPITKNSFGGKESFAPKNPKEVKLPDWANSAIQKLTVPESVVNPVVYNLQNGIKLIVQKETLSNTVSVYGHIKNNSDLEEPKGEEGVGSVLGQLFEFGSNNLNRIQFQKALDDIGADESAGTSFSLNVLSNHFERGIQLLADNELNPALPENAFKIIRQRTSAEVAGELKSPDYLSGRTLLEGLYPKDDPTLRQTTPETLDSLTIQSVKNYYKKVYRPDLTTIVVIGNVEPEKVKNTIENYFGSWQAEGNKPDVELPSVPENKQSVSNVPDKSRIQDEVTLSTNIRFNKIRFRLLCFTAWQSCFRRFFLCN